jgi:hypothetical protein
MQIELTSKGLNVSGLHRDALSTDQKRRWDQRSLTVIDAISGMIDQNTVRLSLVFS